MTGKELNAHAEQYLLARQTCQQYARQIRNRVKWFAESVGERDVTAALLNEYLLRLERAGREPETVRGHRTSLLAVLKFAGWTPDGGVRCAKMKQKEVDCFTLDELRALVKAAQRMQGQLPHGMPLAVFWPLAIDCGYSTGLRYGDLVDVPAASIDDNGECHVTQSKTARVVVVCFTPESVEVIRRHGQEKALPWPFSYNHFRTEFRALVVAAGVRSGSWKWLRRSAGSYAEHKKPGVGHRVLGNTRDIFRGHYWAFKTLQPKPTQPPALRVRWWRRMLGGFGTT